MSHIYSDPGHFNNRVHPSLLTADGLGNVVNDPVGVNTFFRPPLLFLIGGIFFERERCLLARGISAAFPATAMAGNGNHPRYHILGYLRSNLNLAELCFQP